MVPLLAKLRQSPHPPVIWGGAAIGTYASLAGAFESSRKSWASRQPRHRPGTSLGADGPVAAGTAIEAIAVPDLLVEELPLGGRRHEIVVNRARNLVVGV